MVTLALILAQTAETKPARIEVITPIHSESFNKNGTAKVRKQGGNPRTTGGILTFDGSTDGNRQVDPQIAVGGGYVLHGTNSGLVIYDKKGNYVQGVPQSEFNSGIDPKLIYSIHGRFFGFELWNPWDKEGKKPVNVSISQGQNPTGPWNTYAVPAPNGVDGGAIGYSGKWIGVSFPGGSEQTFVMKVSEVTAGKPATVFHFSGSLGHPVYTQDSQDDLYFVKLTDQDIVLTRVSESRDGTPYIVSVTRKPHSIPNFAYPPASPMKGVAVRTASGDRNPKNLVIQSGSLWFSQTVNVSGRAGVQWHQYGLDGSRIQFGQLASPTSSYIQTTLAVNRQNDVLVGFQETSPDMFISARAAIRQAGDEPGTLGRFYNLAEGIAATEGGAWGDYSGSVVDGDNLTDLWTIQSYANSQGKGSTVIAKIPMKKQ
ncbi:MAG: hypothetical protein JSS71_11915 [Armatimonadetes bacterium]|nr:hypothetical protein [Armatimonadota bacterium]MBX3109270.1 hypothetical protein [Fimbriimonadaceae bacterium]